jgi:hypothetical protein
MASELIPTNAAATITAIDLLIDCPPWLKYTARLHVEATSVQDLSIP